MRRLEDYRDAAATLLKQGAYLQAYDTAAEGLQQFLSDLSLRQSLALALARTGATREANRRLRALVDEGHTDEETVAMLARTYKDLWESSGDPVERTEYVHRAQQCYLEAHHKSGGYWSGINAATMALVAGDRSQAEKLAASVRDICLARVPQASERDRYWLLATLGEAALLLRDLAGAESHYRKAVSLQGVGVGELVSTRRNARLILREEGQDAALFDALFRIPHVAAFVGHLIDRPDRAVPRFTPDMEDAVRGALRDRLSRYDIGFAYSSAANGGDILFLETMRDRGAELHIVLPYNREAFLRDSVDFIPGGNWVERCHTLLQQAKSVTVASDQRMSGGDMSYDYAFQLLDGMAAIQADELDTELVCCAVWDSDMHDERSVTGSSVAYWRRAHRRTEIIDIGSMRQSPSPPGGAALGAQQHTVDAPAAEFEARLVGMLFADVAGFSKLTEDQIPLFVKRYLGTIGDVVRGFGVTPLLVNTWGDGLYFVFPGVRETGEFALALSERLCEIDWTEYALPNTLALRIAVHAGPVYECTDPVSSRRNFLGSHVALAARIEPITPPGVVYASGAFAALAKSQDVRAFRCTYVGQTPLAKAYGTMAMYVLTRESKAG